MSDEKKEDFIQVTWKEIMAATLSLLIIGAVTFVFSNFNGRLEKLEDQYTIHDKALNIELIDAVNDLTDELEERTDDLTTFGNNQRRLERSITRLEIIIEEWGKKTMKKLFFILFMLLSFSLFAQEEANWYRSDEVEELMYDWDVEVEAWVGEYEDGWVTLNLEDVWSEDWYDVRAQLSTALYAFFDEMDWNDIPFDEFQFDLIIYSWFEYDDPTDESARYENDELRWDIYLEWDWLQKYFMARRDRDRTAMVSLMVDSFVAQWEEINRELIKRDIIPYQDTIIEQQQLEDSLPELRGKLPNLP